MCVFLFCPGIGPLGVYVYTYSQPLYFFIFLRTISLHNKKGTDELHSASFSRYKGLINRIDYIAYLNFVVLLALLYYFVISTVIQLLLNYGDMMIQINNKTSSIAPPHKLCEMN